MGLGFEHVQVDAGRLPYNYLPLALPGLAGVAGGQDYHLIDPLNLDPGGVPDPVIKAADLGDPARVAQIGAAPGFLYPRGPSPVAAVSSAAAAEGAPPAGSEAIVFFDTGIALWNPAFHDGPGALAPTLGFVDTTGATLLSSQEMRALRDLAASGGDAAVFRELAARFGGSVYANGLRPTQMSHGTAIADTLRRRLKKNRKSLPLLGVELPAAVLLDRSGDLLQAMLFRAVSQVLGQMRQDPRFAGVGTVRLVFPYGFLGGPHDPAHPALAFLHRLAGEGVEGLTLKFFVPMGNHLQGRQHATWPARQMAADTALTWRVHHDDHSPNSVEMVCKAADGLKLHLGPPAGRAVKIALAGGTFGKVSLDGRVIGGVLCRAIGGGRLRLRLSLAPSAAGHGGAVAPYGDWRLGFSARRRASVPQVEMWILRDDASSFRTIAPPNRASEFYDPLYRIRGADNAFEMHDGTGSMVRRAGTASVLAAGHGPRLASVGARLRPHPGGQVQVSPYSGMALDGVPASNQEVVDEGREVLGQMVLGSGSARLYRVTGTSLACAMAAAG